MSAVEQHSLTSNSTPKSRGALSVNGTDEFYDFSSYDSCENDFSDNSTSMSRGPLSGNGTREVYEDFAYYNNLILDSDIPSNLDRPYGTFGDICRVDDITTTFMGRTFTHQVMRDSTTIYRSGFEIRHILPEIESVQSSKLYRVARSRKTSSVTTQSEDDHFDEAMIMFPPLPKPVHFDEAASIPEAVVFTDKEEEPVSYEYHSGFEYSLNPSFVSMPKDETKRRIEERLDFACSLKQQLDSITDAEIELHAKLLDDKVRSVLHKRSLNELEPHAGSEKGSLDYWLDKLDSLSGKMSDYSEVLRSNEADLVIRHIERLVVLFIQLRETSSYTGMVVDVLAYLHGLCSKSLFATIREYICNSLAMEAHSGNEGDSEDDESPAWLQIFRSVTKNWKSATKMPAWKHFQKILSLSVSAGLCKAADVNFTIGTMKLFTIKVNEKQSSAFDLLDAILVTADYFVEAGYEAFRTNSIRPFYFDNQTARILDEAYLKIAAAMKALPTGDLERMEVKTEHELCHLLENTLSGYVILRMQTKNPIEKRTLDARCMKLEEWKLEFIQYTVAGGLREAPYSIYLVGKPGIGKSMMTQVLIEVVMSANGISYEQKNVATVNPGDKFASTVKNNTLVVILDDFGNFVLEFETENPLKYIIEICNNVVSYVPKAEANEKGKIAWRPKLVITTSNMDDLLFNKLSNAPGSAKRRGIRMKPRLKPEFADHDRFSEDKYRAKHGELPAIADAYDIDIQEWGTEAWEFFTHDGRLMKNVSYAQALEFHIAKSREHFAKQKAYVENHGSIREQIHICDHNRVESTCKICNALKEEQEDLEEPGWDEAKFDMAFAVVMDDPELLALEEDKPPPEPEKEDVETNLRAQAILDEVFEPHFGTQTVTTWAYRYVINQAWTYVSPYTQNFRTYLTNSSNDRLRRLNATLHWFSLFGYYDYLPDCIVDTQMFNNYLLFINSTSICLQYWQLFLSFLLSFGIFLLGPSVGGALNGLLIWPYLFHCATTTHVQVITEFRDRRGALPAEFTARRDSFLKYALTGAFILSGLALSYKLYQATNVFTDEMAQMEPQGNIAPQTLADIKARDAEQSAWTKAEAEPLPVVSDKSKCVDRATLVTKVRKNQVYVSWLNDKNEPKFTDGFFYESNELLIPYHILTDKPRKYTIYRKGEHVKGARFAEILSTGSASIHPTKDVAMVQCCNTAPFASLSDYFPIEEVAQFAFELSFQQKDGEYISALGKAYQREVDNGVRKFDGHVYKLDTDTFKGMCMSPLISDSKAPTIAAFHIGGLSGTPTGCSFSLTQAELKEMRSNYFTKHVSALEHISEGQVFEAHYGVQWYESPEIHEKSPLHYLPDQCNIRYFGSCKGRASYYSDVVQTPIAKLVTEVCDHQQQYSGPHFHRWKSWYESLVYSCEPTIGCDTALLDWAVADYSKQIEEILTVDGIIEEVRKLSEIEIVSGRDGVRFIDAMPSGTSCGAPLKGPKSAKMIQLPPNDSHRCPRTFFPGIWEEIRRMKACWKAGVRYYPLFKACLKDEATKVEKMKVRVFQAAPLTLQCVVRELFLPLARVFSLFPLLSECAVGINSQGPEWDALQDHVKKFGADRIVAGDYSKYDLRMSAKLTSAAFKILIDFAEKCGYSQEDLAMMRAAATEICYPMMAFNGDVIMLQGSNPSGQNLTVYINSIVNSLLNRIGFRMLYPEYKGTFQSVIALTTYGDDFKSSASSSIPDFNHITLAEKLDSIGMKITMPDKEATPIPFLQDENCDFLKRQNVFHEVGYYLGALDEDSIFKSLKAVVKSDHCSTREQAAQNIDGAVREWFFHGRETYEKRRAQMKQVAEMSGLTHMTTLLDDDFDKRLDVWRKKYTPLDFDEDVVVEPEVEVFEAHSGTECIPGWLVNVTTCTAVETRCLPEGTFLWFEMMPCAPTEEMLRNPFLPLLYIALAITAFYCTDVIEEEDPMPELVRDE